jgi:succinate dehydrogenase / fumarate reductase membrane anchor subunit
MSKTNNKIISALGKARGLGSSHHGAGHWLHERITGAALVPLTLWLVWAMAYMPGWTLGEFNTWLALPINAILMLLSVILTCYHTAMGIQVIVEDYVHHEGAKWVMLLVSNAFFLFTGVACVFAVLKIAFTSGI